MSDAIMRKSYTVVCVRTTGQPMDLETVADYMAAMNSAKAALTNKNNVEVRIVESKYDQATRRDKKQVIKILTADKPSGGGGSRANKNKPTVTREVANQATKSLINVVIAITVLVLLAGVLVPLMMR